MSNDMVLRADTHYTDYNQRIENSKITKPEEHKRSIFERIDDGIGLNWLKKNVKKYTGITYLTDKVTDLVDDGDDTKLSLGERLWEGVKGAGKAVENFIGSQGLAFMGALMLGSYAAGLAGIGKLFNVVTKGYFLYQGSKLAIKGTIGFVEADTKEEAKESATTAATGGIMLFGTIKGIRRDIKAYNTAQAEFRAEVESSRATLEIEDGEVLNEATLKRAYRQAAIKNHPDKGGSEAAMAEVISAYEFLSKNLGKASKITTSATPTPAVETPSAAPFAQTVQDIAADVTGETGLTVTNHYGIRSTAPFIVPLNTTPVSAASAPVSSQVTTAEGMITAIQNASDIDALRSLRPSMKGMPTEVKTLYIQKEQALRSELLPEQKAVRAKLESENSAPQDMRSVVKGDGTVEYYNHSSLESPIELLREEHFPDGRVKQYSYEGNIMSATKEIFPDGRIVEYVCHDEITYPDKNLWDYIKSMESTWNKKVPGIVIVKETLPDGTIIEGWMEPEDGTVAILSETLPDGTCNKHDLFDKTKVTTSETDSEGTYSEDVIIQDETIVTKEETTVATTLEKDAMLEPKNSTPQDMKAIVKSDGTVEYYNKIDRENPYELLQEEHFTDGTIKKYFYNANTNELIATEKVLPNGVIKKTDLRPNSENVTHTDELYPNGQIIKYTYKKDTKTLISTEEIYPGGRVMKQMFYNADNFPDQYLLQNIRIVNNITIGKGSIITKTEEISPDGTIREGIILGGDDNTPKLISVKLPNGVIQKYGLILKGGTDITEEIYPDGRTVRYFQFPANLYPNRGLMQELNINDNQTVIKIEDTHPDGTVTEGLLIPSSGNETPIIASETTPDGTVKIFDANGKIIKETAPDRSTREYTYSENGSQLLHKETFTNKTYKIYDYADGKQVLVEERTLEGKIMEYSQKEHCTKTYKINYEGKRILIEKVVINGTSKEIFTYNDFGDFKKHQIIYSNGDRVYLDKNGKIETYFSADGTTRRYYNGVLGSETYPDGTEFHYDYGKIYWEKHPDGSYKCYYQRTSILREERLTDGTVKEYHEDGSLKRIKYPDGRDICYDTDGNMHILADIDSEGTVIRYYRDGTAYSKNYTDGSTIRYYQNGLPEYHVFSDGSTIEYYEDGSIEYEKYPNGVVRQYIRGKRHKLRGPDSFFKYIYKSIFNK